MVGNVQQILELDRLGVEVVSVREPWLDTGGPVRTLLIAIFPWVAEEERRQIASRSRAGVDRARLSGKHCGRPPSVVDVEHALRLRSQGLSLGERGVPEALALGTALSRVDFDRRQARHYRRPCRTAR